MREILSPSFGPTPDLLHAWGQRQGQIIRLLEAPGTEQMLVLTHV